MSWFDRIVLLSTALIVLYLIWRFYGRYTQKNWGFVGDTRETLQS